MNKFEETLFKIYNCPNPEGERAKKIKSILDRFMWAEALGDVEAIEKQAVYEIDEMWNNPELFMERRDEEGRLIISKCAWHKDKLTPEEQEMIDKDIATISHTICMNCQKQHY